MTTQEIYKLANEFTNQEINNVLFGWENTSETKQIERFNSLVSLGDSRGLALATTIAEKYNSKDSYNTFYNAYCI
jgi:hypothetical protein